MRPLDPRILDFIHEHHVLALASCANRQPWTASCFYVYLDEVKQFIFTTDPATRHAREMEQNPRVAANIALETTMVGKIQGLQITGNVNVLSGENREIAQKAYRSKFPVSRLTKLNLWGLEPDYIKMTHNRLGFGKKLIWSSL